MKFKAGNGHVGRNAGIHILPVLFKDAEQILLQDVIGGYHIIVGIDQCDQLFIAMNNKRFSSHRICC